MEQRRFRQKTELPWLACCQDEGIHQHVRVIGSKDDRARSRDGVTAFRLDPAKEKPKQEPSQGKEIAVGGHLGKDTLFRSIERVASFF